MKLNEIKPNERNPRTITKDKLEKLKRSIKDFDKMMSLRPIVVDENNFILGGNMRYNALKALGYKEIPDTWIKKAEDLTEEEKRRFIIEDNVGFGEWDWDMLANEWEVSDLQEWGLDLPNFEVEEEATAEEEHNDLKELFLMPPLSVLNQSSGEWQKRKRMWMSTGLKSDEGRDGKMMKNLSELAKKSNFGAYSDESVFDPVLCELIYTWFNTKGGVILDPFSGGSVRGIVASFKEMPYFGIDIRQEQVDANIKQIDICSKNKYKPVWFCGDSAKINKILDENFMADFVFSCPPYADLEVYSDKEGDLSNMKYEDFKRFYFLIINEAVKKLNNNRFCCFVVGEVRDKKGIYYNFVSDTIKAFESAGARYYNEIILKTCTGTKALTCGRSMKLSRKIEKTHNNVLVFIKGDVKEAVKWLGDIEVYDMSKYED